jgi:hypothetical protein
LSARILLPALAVAALLAACARPGATTSGPPDAAASLAVDVYGGAATSPSAPPAAVAFRVLAADGEQILAEGRTGQNPVSVPSGVVILAVALDPLERVGPFRLHPGETARVRILDTIDAATSRIWRIERGDEVVGRAFPPPDEFPARSGP